jgi:hypothetical protein
MRTAYGSRTTFYDDDSIERFERCGQMSAAEAFVKAMGDARRRALVEQREAERIAEEGGSDLLGVAAVAEALQLNPEVVARRMKRGRIRGAFLQQGRWRLRRVDLWRQLASGRPDTEGAA